MQIFKHHHHPFNFLRIIIQIKIQKIICVRTAAAEPLLYIRCMLQPHARLLTMITRQSQNSQLKGEVSPNNNVDWVSRKQFTNPTVKVWADLDNPLKRSDYAKLCMSPSSGWNSARICDITRGQLSIDFVHVDFHNFLFFVGISKSFWSSSFINAWTFISALTYLHVCM